MFFLGIAEDTSCCIYKTIITFVDFLIPFVLTAGAMFLPDNSSVPLSLTSKGYCWQRSVRPHSGRGHTIGTMTTSPPSRSSWHGHGAFA